MISTLYNNMFNDNNDNSTELTPQQPTTMISILCNNISNNDSNSIKLTPYQPTTMITILYNCIIDNNNGNSTESTPS